MNLRIHPTTQRATEAHPGRRVHGQTHGHDSPLWIICTIRAPDPISTAPHPVETLPITREGGIPWAGIAGAPLWIDGEIVGVVTAAGESTRRLFAIRAERLLANPDFSRLVGNLSEAEALYRQFGEHAFARLSPSSASALAYADGLRAALDQGAVHMEHLILGLNQKVSGPTQQLLDRAGIGEAGLRAALVEAVDATFPPTVVPNKLNSLPRVSRHVAEALDHSIRLADAAGSQVVRSRHLLYGALSVVDCSVVQALAKRGVHLSGIDDFEVPFAPSGDVYSAATIAGRGVRHDPRTGRRQNQSGRPTRHRSRGRAPRLGPSRPRHTAATSRRSVWRLGQRQEFLHGSHARTHR